MLIAKLKKYKFFKNIYHGSWIMELF